MCNKCEDAGKRGGRHSALLPAPVVRCNRCHQLDHISKNYTNPRGCPFRVHLVSTFSFHAFAAHPCYGIILFCISIYFPFGWSSFPRLRPGGVLLSAPFLPSPPPPPFFSPVLCPLVYISFQLSFSCVRRTPLLRYKFRFRVSVYFPSGWSFAFSCTSHFNSSFHAFAARPCYGINFVSVFQFIFLSGGLRDPWATPLRAPQ